MLKFLLGFIVTLFLLNIVDVHGRYADRGKGPKNNNYDIFVLAQSCPQTSCWSLNRKEPTTNSCTLCKVPKSNNWTLHGLWPSNRHGPHVGSCNQVKFNPNLLDSDLKAELIEKWPTYNLKMNVNAFWNHEYKKHGSCCLDNDETNTLPKYFGKALSLLDQYNIGRALQQANIVPGKSYSFDQFYSAIKRSFSVNPFVQCTHIPEHNEQHVLQVYVCFDKSFNLVDCDEDKGNISNCKRKNKIAYPKNLRTC